MLIDKQLVLDAKQKLGDKAAYIIAKELQFEKFDEKNLKACCKWHQEDTPSLVWNSKDNYWKCFGCGKCFDILDFYMLKDNLTYLGAVEKLFSEVGVNYKFGEKGVKTKRDYKYPKHECNEDRTQVEEYLALRKISKDTLDYCDVQQDNHNNIVFHYYDSNDVLMTVKYRPARKLQDHDIKAWCQKDKDFTPLLFNMNKIDPTHPLLICEGEIDTLSAIEAGFKNAVSVPIGAGNDTWIEENFEWLEQFEKIIIWSDNDQPGLKMRKNIIPRLGEWKCFVVDLPTELEKDSKQIKVKDINEVLYYFGKEKVLDFIDNAKEIPISHIVDFADVEDFDIQNAEGVYTRIKGLDSYLSKLFFGSFNIFTGINGSGKSTLLNQIGICEALDQGYDTFIYSGELPHWQLKNWIVYNLSGRRHIETIKRPNQPDIYKIKPEIKQKISDHYRGRLFFYDNQEDRTARGIINKMTELARKNGTKVFIIDNFTVVDLEANENNKWEKQKDFIVDLIKFATNYNVLVILVIHPHKLDTIRRMNKMDVQGTSSAIDLAHRIIGVHRVRPKEKEGTKNKRGEWITPPNPFDVMIDIFKDRLIGFEDVEVGSYYDRASRRFWSDLEELDYQYAWDKGAYKDKLLDPRQEGMPNI